MKVNVIQILILFNFSCVLCFEPFFTGYTAYLIAAAGTGYIASKLFSEDKNNIVYNVAHEVKQIVRKGCVLIGYCEGCEDKWINPNLLGLQRSFTNEVFGQKLATQTILNVLEHHFSTRNKRNKKALLLSFHGAPGVGKNFVSNLMLKHLFLLGGKTNFVKFFRGSIDFPVTQDVYTYMERVRNEVRSKAEECNRSIFVFDEVDKMPHQVLNALITFVTEHSIEGKVDYRNLIFIFLSNLAAQDINNVALRMYQNKEGHNMYDFERIIKDTVYRTKGGFYKSEIIEYVDHFIPFLPLTKNDLYSCLEIEVAKMNQVMSEELYNQVIEEITFYPPELEIFAVHGCKSVGEKAGSLIYNEIRKMRNS